MASNLALSLTIALVGVGMALTADRSAHIRRASEHEHSVSNDCDSCRTDPVDLYMPKYFAVGALMAMGGGVLTLFALLDALTTLVGLN